MHLDDAKGQPTKRFFIEMLTADIPLEDAILDLVDNSVDAIMAKNNRLLDENLISGEVPHIADSIITMTISATEVLIEDRGIGITEKDAQDRVFRLGRIGETNQSTLGVFGIGMKRALFKLGNRFQVDSLAADSNAFRAELVNVEAWQEEDNGDAADWNIPLVRLEDPDFQIGTRIKITELRPEVIIQLSDAAFLARLREELSQTYALLVGRYLDICLNDVNVISDPVRIGSSEAIQFGLERKKLIGDSVSVTTLTGLLDKGMYTSDDRLSKSAGWYIYCNGRLVLRADKSAATGWGVDANPIYVPTFRSFVGVVLIFATDSSLLPWRTTKHGLNSDSEVALQIKPIMWALARPVLSFLRSFYYADEQSTTHDRRRLASQLNPLDLFTIGQQPPSTFTVAPELLRRGKKPPKDPEITQVQYAARRQEIEAAGRLLGEPGASAARVGRVAFDMLLEGDL